MNLLPLFWKDDSGATMVEYALLLAFIAIVCFAAVQIFGEKVAETMLKPELDAVL